MKTTLLADKSFYTFKIQRINFKKLYEYLVANKNTNINTNTFILLVLL